MEVHTLIGDIVGSRALPDRSAGQRRLDEVLTQATTWLRPTQPLQPTVGDEFQGAFPDLATATGASLWIRLSLLPEIDVRCGLGYGEVTVLDADRAPLLQDGPGWWCAREAIQVLGRPRMAARRTYYSGPDDGLINAFLTTRDGLVDRLGDAGRYMLRLSLEGRSQKEIAAEVGVSKSAVSQQFSRGVGAVRDAQSLMEGR